MSVVLLQLSLCVLTVTQLTSSQPTHDVISQQYDVMNCKHTEHVLDELVTTVKQLRRDVVELKTANQRQTVTECPADFTRIASVKGCYKVSTHKVEWSIAGLECRSLHEDAHLLVINDEAEQLAVGAWLTSINNTTTGCYPRSKDYYGMVFWTAGQRIDPSTNSTFVWRVTSTNTYSERVSVMTYTNWEPGQPSYWQQDESCVHFSSKLSYQWNDCPCSRSFICSVCEIDITK